MSSGTLPGGSNISILVVDDEADITEVFESLLVSEGYTVERASSGEEAILKLGEKEFHLILADIRMPNMSGLELLAWTKKNQPKLRTILVTGLTNLEMTKAALDLGCEAFLAKPVDRSELLKTVQFALSEPENEIQREGNYGQVPIEDFISGKNLPYSIYVRLVTGRFVKIAHTGEDLDLGRIYNLKFKSVNELWLEKGDFLKYQAMSQRLAAGVATMTQVSADKKAKVIEHACQIAAQKLQMAGVEAGSLESASQLLNAALTLTLESPGSVAMLEVMNTRLNGRYAHASTTALLAILITQVMGWTNKKNIFSLALAGFFHDIGLMDAPEGLEDKPLADMSEEEKTIYLNHPARGVELLKDLPGLPSEVLTIVSQHHESGKESGGFPRNIQSSEVFPMARILRLLDEFSHRLLRSQPAGRAPALKTLQNLLADETLGSFDFTTTCAMEALLAKNEIQAAKKRFTIALTDKRTA